MHSTGKSISKKTQKTPKNFKFENWMEPEKMRNVTFPLSKVKPRSKWEKGPDQEVIPDH